MHTNCNAAGARRTAGVSSSSSRLLEGKQHRRVMGFGAREGRKTIEICHATKARSGEKWQDWSRQDTGHCRFAWLGCNLQLIYYQRALFLQNKPTNCKRHGWTLAFVLGRDTGGRFAIASAYIVHARAHTIFEFAVPVDCAFGWIVSGSAFHGIDLSLVQLQN